MTRWTFQIGTEQGAADEVFMLILLVHLESADPEVFKLHLFDFSQVSICPHQICPSKSIKIS